MASRHAPTPRLLDTTTRTGTIADAVNLLLATRGASALTMRAIAAECRLSPAALSLHYGSRRHMLAVAALATSRARTARMQERARRDGVLAFLPREPEEVLDVRAWLAWCELDRDEEALHHTMWWARAEDRALLDDTLDHRLGPTDLDLLVAAIDGLAVALCRPEDPMPLPAAQELLQRLAADLIDRSAA
ncbi:helix-turn-helix domain-containing protein [Nocardioides psychrotolerans]|uniref:helix-turn-helix domain-containing protein n=1 Tax=Nocardioides psychrotolerans TaxID=1005945 RepID=UPI0031377290